MAEIVSPVPTNAEFETPAWQQFFELLRKQANNPVFYSSSADPGTANVPSGSWSMWKNTTSGQVRIWVNDAGVMRSVQLV